MKIRDSARQAVTGAISRPALLSLLAGADEDQADGAVEQACRYLDDAPEDGEVRAALIDAEKRRLFALSQSCATAGADAPDDKRRVSVLVSTYKSGAFMRECLDELQAQTIAGELEVIVVDAASPENERAVVEEFMNRWSASQPASPRIRYYRTPERIGIYHAWNLAAFLARAGHLTPLSANDHLAAGAYERMAGYLDAHRDVYLVYGDTHLTERPHERFDTYTPTANYGGEMRWPDYSYYDHLFSNRIGPHPMWRREVHGRLGYFDKRYTALADQDFFLRIGRELPVAHLAEFTGLAWATPDALSGKAVAFRETFEVQTRHQRRYLREQRREYSQVELAHLADMFVKVILRSVEDREIGEAAEFCRRHRPLFRRTPELDRLDSVMARLTAASPRAKTDH